MQSGKKCFVSVQPTSCSLASADFLEGGKVLVAVSSSNVRSIRSSLLRLPKKLRDFAFAIPKEFAYRRAIAQHARRLPILSSADLAIAQALETEGVFVTSIDVLGLPHTAAMLSAAESLMLSMPTVPSAQSGFDVHANQAEILEHPALFRWGLSSRLLDIAESYLKLPVCFNDIHLRRDFANNVVAGSRLWHVDSYDHRILRIFVYLNEVSETGGPFEYISRQATRSIVPILEQFGTKADRLVNQLIAPNRSRCCTGSKGTVVFAATSQILHRGKLPVTSDRFTLVFNYNSRSLKRPAEGTPLTPKAERLAIANQFSFRQQQCLLWQ